MKFQLIVFRVCLIFTHVTILRTSKSIGNNTMKKMLLATALALLITGCSTDVYCSKQTGSSSTKGNHHPSFLRFWNSAEENWSMQLKFKSAQKNVINEKPSKHSDCFGFITFSIYTRWKRVCIAHNNA